MVQFEYTDVFVSYFTLEEVPKKLIFDSMLTKSLPELVKAKITKPAVSFMFIGVEMYFCSKGVSMVFFRKT